MPPFVRILAKLLIGFPGLLIWAYACLMTASFSSFVMRGAHLGEWLGSIVTILVGFLVAQIGHAMRVMTGIFTDTQTLRFAGERLATRLAWDALVQFAGILSVGAGLAALSALFNTELPRLAWTGPLFLGLAWTFRYLWRRRFDLHTRWCRELSARESERALIEFDARRVAQEQTSSSL